MPDENREKVIMEMRNNLLIRNNNASEYTLSYTEEGHTFDINTCSEEELQKINGDMNPLGL